MKLSIKRREIPLIPRPFSILKRIGVGETITGDVHRAGDGVRQFFQYPQTDRSG